jgi:hypothetical protein
MENIKSLVSKHSAIFNNPPKRVPDKLVVDGPLIGNGDIGVVLSGEPDKLTFWISKCDFWKGKSWYPEGGVRGLGGITFEINALKDANYHVEQSMYDGCIKAKFKNDLADVELCAWTPNNLLIIEMKNVGPDICIQHELWTLDDKSAVTSSGFSDGKMKWISKKYESSDLDWPSEGFIGMQAIGTDLESNLIKSGDTVIFTFAICTSFETDHCHTFALNLLSNLQSTSITNKRQVHENWWRSFWSKSTIEIDDKLIEQFWYSSHYIMACCSGNEKFPPGLFGNWITTNEPEWAGDYHLNYNYQAPWWGVFSSNHVELTRPYDMPLLQYMEKGKANAKRLLKKNGLYFDVGIGPLGCTSSQDANDKQFFGQKSNAAYSAINMLMRFYHTYDLDYVRGGVYEFLCQTALFWEEYLVYENGRYMVYNDAIHETYDAVKNKNPILSLGLLKALFKGLVDISTELDMNESKLAKWKHIYENMSEFPTQIRDNKKVFRYTEEGLDWWSDNTLGIQHIWPCGTIGLDSDAEILNVSHNTITELDRWTDYNGFPTFFTAAARVGYNPEIILSKLRLQCEEHSFPNLFIYFGGGGIETCSAVPSCINEMLLQSHEGVLRLFPVYPQKGSAKFQNLRAVGAFLVSAEMNHGIIEPVKIVSEKGRRCTFENAWNGKKLNVSCLYNGKKKSVDFDIIGNRISFDTLPEITYVIS